MIQSVCNKELARPVIITLVTLRKRNHGIFWNNGLAAPHSTASHRQYQRNQSLPITKMIGWNGWCLKPSLRAVSEHEVGLSKQSNPHYCFGFECNILKPFSFVVKHFTIVVTAIFIIWTYFLKPYSLNILIFI